MKKLLIIVPLAAALLVGCKAPQDAPKPTHTASAPATHYTPRHKTTHKITPKPRPKATPNSKMYTSCVQAFNESHVPVRKGEPQYNPKLDGDHDGLACEHED